MTTADLDLATTPASAGHFFSVPLEAFRQLTETGALPADVKCTQCGRPRGQAPH